MTLRGWAKGDIIKINLQDRKVEIVKAKGDDVVQCIDDKGQLKDRYTYWREWQF